MNNVLLQESNYFVHAVTQVKLGRLSQTLDWYIGVFYDETDAKSCQVDLYKEWDISWPEEGGALQPPVFVSKKDNRDYFVTYACMISEIELLSLFEARRVIQQGYRVIPPFQIFNLVNHVPVAGRQLVSLFK